MTATENGQTTPAVVDEKAASHPSIGQANNEHDVFLVDFAGQDDPYNPVNWSLGKKMVTTLLWALTTCWIAFASAVCSAGIEQIVDEFHVNHETAASGVSLMIFDLHSAPCFGLRWAKCIIIGIVLTGFGFFCMFQSALNYLVDTFTRYSASAIAANTFVRSIAAGAFPLFVSPMYSKLGVNWGSTVFACVSVVLIPVPFIFFTWGERIRQRGQLSKLSAM